MFALLNKNALCRRAPKAKSLSENPLTLPSPPEGARGFRASSNSTRLWRHASLLLVIPLCRIATGGEAFEVRPPKVTLEGYLDQAQLVASALDETGAVSDRSEDLTTRALFATSDAGVVAVDERGRLTAQGEGAAVVSVRVGDVVHDVAVVVAGVGREPRASFSGHVLPILSKAGCNAGACHAAQYGQAGFKLSVFGYAPLEDYEAITRDRAGRRLSVIVPEESLLLRKPTRMLPHGGGRRLERGSVDYQLLEAWIAAGAPPPNENDPRVTAIDVWPTRRLGEPGFTQQLQVVASYRDDRRRDVTAWAKFDTLDEGVAQVARDGLITATGRGQAPVMVRFEGQAQVSLVVVPHAATVELGDWEDQNFIDTLAAAKFRQLGIQPSPLCDDATFLRRAYLDAIGTLPSVEESTAFLDSTELDKRNRLIDRLLGLTGDISQDIYNDAYAAYWALKWADLIRSSSDNLGEQGMWALHNWITESLRTNKPFDAFVRELITARGSLYMNAPANYFRIAAAPADLAESTAQLFLGVRLACAKCHHHPFEKYGQDDYFSLAAFFARVGLKGSQEFGLFGGEQVLVVRPGGEVTHPRTGQVMAPRVLDEEPWSADTASAREADRRARLATWLTSADNALFSRNVVNRYVAYLLGRGLVEPVDDLRATNPPSNPELMDALAAGFAQSAFDLKQLLRTIMRSRLYQLDSRPTAANASDERFYSHYRVKRLSAEVLLDAIDRATSVPTKFTNMPSGTRAIELPDSNYADYFLKTFGKPRRVSVCECERAADANLAQALHTLNGDILAGKIAQPQGRVARLLEAGAPREQVVSELYLSTLCRRPTAAEMAACEEMFAGSPSAKEFYEDLLWALINSKAFLFVN